MVDKNQRYLGSFHQRLKRAPIINTTKSPSTEAAIRRLIVAIGEIVPQGVNSSLVAQWQHTESCRRRDTLQRSR